MNKRCFKGGFTLIELLVVVLIIGILAAIALPQYNKAVEKSRVSEALTMMNSLEKAMDEWILRNGGTGNSGVVFLGGERTRQDELVLDLNHLECGNYGRIGYYCASKDFFYSIINSRHHMFIEGWRYMKGNLLDSDYYLLEIDIAPTGEHTRTCYYEDDLGKNVCQSLTSQGWTVEEGI